MNWFEHSANRITNTPSMPLTFRDAQTQAFHIDCSKFDVNIELDAPVKYEPRRQIFLWRRDTNQEHRLIIERTWELLPGGFVLIESRNEAEFKIRAGLAGGLRNLTR